VPHAIQNDLTLREQGLVVILAESQGSEFPVVEQFVWKTFKDCEARVTTAGANPLPEFSGLPTSAVIGPDGKLAFMANPLGGGLDEVIATELKKVEKGWGATKEEARVRALIFGKKDYAGAKKLIDAMQGAVKDTLAAELQAQVDRRIAMAKALQEAGRWGAAKDVIQQLAGKTTGIPDWQAPVAELVASLATPAAKEELARDDKIEKFLKAHRSGKDKPAKDLEKVVKDAPESTTGKRAARLLAATGGVGKA
jgi:hypothetical protein